MNSVRFSIWLPGLAAAFVDCSTPIRNRGQGKVFTVVYREGGNVFMYLVLGNYRTLETRRNWAPLTNKMLLEGSSSLCT